MVPQLSHNRKIKAWGGKFNNKGMSSYINAWDDAIFDVVVSVDNVSIVSYSVRRD